jgi:ATP-dependent Clp protease adaptor protein ClpS
VALPITDVVCETREMATTKPLRDTSVNSDVQADVSVVTERPWNVVVWNDPVTPMTVVVVIFKRIFGYSNNKCTHLMMTVHHEGRAIVWSGQRERAETYCVKLQVAGLQATVERDA